MQYRVIKSFLILASAVLATANPAFCAESSLQSRGGKALAAQADAISASGWSGGQKPQVAPAPNFKAQPLDAATVEEQQRERISAITKLASVVGSTMPIALFNRMATATSLPQFQHGDGHPYGKLMKFPDGSQRMLVIRSRADGTRDILLVTAPPNGGSNYYYLIDGSGNLIAGYFAQTTGARRVDATEAARLSDELAYWQKWQEDTNRARMAQSTPVPNTGNR